MEEIEREENARLKRYKQTLRDIRYVHKTYGKRNPSEALECIRKLAYDPKLRLRGLAGQVKEENQNG